MTPLTARKQERKLVHTVHQFVHHFSVLIYAPILQDRFQKRNSPLGFMIDTFIKKTVHRGMKPCSYTKKMKFTWKKTKFTYDLRLFMTIYQKS